MIWRPGDVVVRDRSRGVCVWFILIVGIITYTTWLVKAAVDSRQNPSTSFVTSNDAYNYPDVMVCMYEGYGCDQQEDEGDCAFSSNKTDGVTQAKFNPDSDNEQDVLPEPGLTSDRGFCVKFNTSQVVTPDGEPNPEDYFILDVSWYPGGHDNTSTTCIQQQGEWTSHSESVSVFFTDPETGTLSAGMQLPYTCMTNQSSGHIFNYVGIGLTRKVKLDPSDNSDAYRALITYAYFKKDKRDDIAGISKPYARFSLEVGREINSLEVITDVDPFEIEGIFGEIGGAWDLLLMLWPIFFVYAVPREAQYKARSFRKSARRASGLARTLKTSVSFKPKEQRLPIRPSRAPQSCCEETVSPCASLQSLGSVTPNQTLSSRGIRMSSSQKAGLRTDSSPSMESPHLPPPHLQALSGPGPADFIV